MTTMQFLTAILNWLQSDPIHVFAACALINSLVPTPNPNTALGKAYKILEVLALSFGRSKETGLPSPSFATLADQVAEAIAKKQPVAQPAAPVVLAPTPAPAAPTFQPAPKEPA